MISATTNFKNMIARPVGSVTPVYVITIGKYTRAFTNQRNSDGTGLTISGYSGATLYPWITSIADFDVTLNDLDGGADVTQFSFTIQDHAGTITGDFPSNVLEGQTVTVMMGFVGLAYADFITVFKGYVDKINSVNANLEYQFNCLDFSGYLSQVVYQTGDNGGPTSSSNLKTLNNNPLSILLNILQNQVGSQVGTKKLPPNTIDTTTIQAYIDGPFNGVNFVFHLQQAPAAGDFIKNQLLKPMGGYLCTNAAGQITVRFFYPLAGPVAAGTFDQHTWISIPEAEQCDMVNTVDFQFDKDDDTPTASGNYLSEVVEEYGQSFAKYGVVGEQVIAADGLRSGFQGVFIALVVSRLIFLRYGLKNLKFEQGAAESHLDTCLYELGDIVSVTHPSVPDRQAGVIGITNKLFEIVGKKWNFTEGLLQYSMIDASYLSTFGFFEVAPKSEAGYASASSGDKALYLFMCSTLGKYSTGASANVLG